jgi:hypothetical protein
MRDHAARTTLALLVAASFAVAGCSSGSGKDKGAASTPTREAPSQAGAVPTVNMPDLVGQELGAAVAAVKTAGFTDVVFHDSAGKGRTPAADATWRVCDQTPAPGPTNPKDKVDLGAVPKKESCQGHPTTQPPPVQPTGTPTKITPTTKPGDKPPTLPTWLPTRFYFRNCEEAKAAGVAPIKRGEPGYSRRLDRDGDGVACDK